MSVKPITNSLPISYEGEGLPLLKQIAQDTHIAAQAAQRQLLFSKIRLGLTAFLTALMLFAFLLWGPKLHRTLQNADRAFDGLEAVSSQLAQADIPSLLASMDQLAREGRSSLKAIQKTAEVLENIDMDQLNQAIADPQKAVSPLAKLFG